MISAQGHENRLSPKITFSKQLNGYNTEQVDNYIAMLAKEYQNAYEQHTAVSDKYNRLLESHARLENEITARRNADTANEIAVKTLAGLRDLVAPRAVPVYRVTPGKK